MREFAGGATRNDDSKKNDMRGFDSPLARKIFGDYMTEHRTQKDGTQRASDNWKKGMPRLTYLSSLKRHVEDVHMIMEGHVAINPDTGKEVTLQEALCGTFFNTQGLLHEVALGRDIQVRVEAPQTVETRLQHSPFQDEWHDVGADECFIRNEAQAKSWAGSDPVKLRQFREVPA